MTVKVSSQSPFLHPGSRHEHSVLDGSVVFNHELEHANWLVCSRQFYFSISKNERHDSIGEMTEIYNTGKTFLFAIVFGEHRMCILTIDWMNRRAIILSGPADLSNSTQVGE